MAYDIRQYLKIQLNEKVSANQIDVLYPETLANYVVTNDDKMFVSKADKESWNQAVTTLQKGLLYYGQHSVTETYPLNAVVEKDGKYFISLQNNNLGNVPDGTDDYNEYWANINFEAYVADNAEKIKVATNAVNEDQYITFVQSTAEGYKALGIGSVKYNPSTNTLTVSNIVGDTITANKFVGNLQGKADTAGAADTATEAEIANKYRVDDSTTASIKEKFDSLEETISGIQGGGTFTAQSLTIKVEGKDDVVFNGKEAKTVEIKQSYATADITDLTEGGKIKNSWLPDTVLGQLEYKGVFNPSVAGSVQVEKGNYYIANANGSYNPDGTSGNEYSVGDWAVYNGTSWDKIDNTDAVTMVNGQIGAVEVYKGAWVAQTKYYKGDIVKQDGKLYICNATHTAATDFVADNWELFGRSYTGDEIINVSGDNITHKKFEEAGTETTQTLAAGETFNVPVLTRDSYGHISKIDVKKITLGTDFVDTTRPIKVNGVDALSGTGEQRSKALDISNGNVITVKYENDKLAIDHNTTGNGALDLQASTNAAGDVLYAGNTFTVPSIQVDAYGHVSGTTKTIKLAEASIKHNLFNITKDATGAQVIGAYTGIDNIAGLGDLKFYQGTAVPTSEEVLKLNGAFVATKLYQGANQVVDQTAKLYVGNGYNSVTGNFDRELIGSFDAANNRFTMPETGITSGVYSAVNVNRYGVVTAGGQIVEVGKAVGDDPSESLAVGGLFFRRVE